MILLDGTASVRYITVYLFYSKRPLSNFPVSALYTVRRWVGQRHDFRGIGDHAWMAKSIPDMPLFDDYAEARYVADSLNGVKSNDRVLGKLRRCHRSKPERACELWTIIRHINPDFDPDCDNPLR